MSLTNLPQPGVGVLQHFVGQQPQAQPVQQPAYQAPQQPAYQAPQQPAYQAPQQPPVYQQPGMQTMPQQPPGYSQSPVTLPPAPQQPPQSDAHLLNQVRSAFSGITGTKAAKQGTYFMPGKYLVRFDGANVGEKRGKGAMIFANCTIMAVIAETVPGMVHRVDDQPSFCFKSWDINYYKQDLTSFVSGLFGIQDVLVGEADVDKCMFSGILVNMVAEVECRRIKLKSTGQPFDKPHVVRGFRPADVLQLCPPDMLAKYFPANYMQTMAANMAQQPVG